MRYSRNSITKNNDQLQRQLEIAIVRVLSEFAGVVIGAGVTPTAFSDLARIAFVNAASDLCLMKNGRVNESRVAVITGLSRQEVARVRRAGNRARLPGALSRAARIIRGWSADKQFHGSNGCPASLDLCGERKNFGTLVRRYGGDVPPAAALAELKRLNAVRIVKGQVHLLTSATKLIHRDTAAFSSGAGKMVFALQALSPARKSDRTLSFEEIVSVRDPIEADLISKKIGDALSAAFRSIGALKYPRCRPTHIKSKRHTIRAIAVMAPYEIADPPSIARD
jgi:hypothetical protein